MAVEIHQVHRFSVEEYHRPVEAGGFDARSRVELIELDDRRAVVHRDVTAEGYASVLEVGASGRLAPRALKLPDLPLAELLAACSTR